MARVYGLILWPIVVYLFWFWVHFAVLSKSGSGDDFMSPAFQETLQDSPMMLASQGRLRLGHAAERRGGGSHQLSELRHLLLRRRDPSASPYQGLPSLARGQVSAQVRRWTHLESRTASDRLQL